MSTPYTQRTLAAVELTIREVTARGLDVAMDRPVETASGVLRSAPLVLIDLLAEEGVNGRAYVRA